MRAMEVALGLSIIAGCVILFCFGVANYQCGHYIWGTYFTVAPALLAIISFTSIVLNKWP